MSQGSGSVRAGSCVATPGCTRQPQGNDDGKRPAAGQGRCGASPARWPYDHRAVCEQDDHQVDRSGLNVEPSGKRTSASISRGDPARAAHRERRPVPTAPAAVSSPGRGRRSPPTPASRGPYRFIPRHRPGRSAGGTVRRRPAMRRATAPSDDRQMPAPAASRARSASGIARPSVNRKIGNTRSGQVRPAIAVFTGVVGGGSCA